MHTRFTHRHKNVISCKYTQTRSHGVLIKPTKSRKRKQNFNWVCGTISRWNQITRDTRVRTMCNGIVYRCQESNQTTRKNKSRKRTSPFSRQIVKLRCQPFNWIMFNRFMFYPLSSSNQRIQNDNRWQSSKYIYRGNASHKISGGWWLYA